VLNLPATLLPHPGMLMYHTQNSWIPANTLHLVEGLPWQLMG
jgi:hypothetical protein